MTNQVMQMILRRTKNINESESKSDFKTPIATSSPTGSTSAPISSSANNIPKPPAVVVSSHADPTFASSLTWDAPPTLHQSYEPGATDASQAKAGARVSRPPVRY